jgi:hypothetical protein
MVSHRNEFDQDPPAPDDADPTTDDRAGYTTAWAFSRDGTWERCTDWLPAGLDARQLQEFLADAGYYPIPGGPTRGSISLDLYAGFGHLAVLWLGGEPAVIQVDGLPGLLRLLRECQPLFRLAGGEDQERRRA